MALIKCYECGHDVSDHSMACPSCGNPILNQGVQPNKAIEIRQKNKWWSKKSFWVDLTFLVGIGLITIYGVQLNSSYSGPGTFIGNLSQDLDGRNFGKAFNDIFGAQRNANIQFYGNSPPALPLVHNDPLNAQANPIGGKTYPTQDNNFWGYDFYTSNIDASGNIDIGSAAKQNIAKLLNALG